jgi:signal transduction histidine kinase/phage shock protein PspC (stress-responsive transcriptional regulator)
MHANLRVPAAIEGLRFPRSGNDRLVAGVAGGLARRLEADSYVVRVAFVVLSLAGGAGVVLYALAWLLSEPSRDEAAAVVRPERSLAVGCVTAALLVVLRDLGLWPGDAVMVPAIVVAAGSALVWHDPRGSTGVRGPADPFERLMSGRLSAPRVVGGVVLVATGIAALASDGDLSSVPRSVAALTLALAGVVLVVGPYAGRLLSEVRSAERERIRTEERAEMAAHLHDSVLQTLALMQRSADDPRRMILLARRQERELRQWLYGGGPEAATEGSVAERAKALAAEIELDHDVPVELVVVGDHPGNEALVALLGAVREASVNAARHAGADKVDIYLEIGPSSAVAFVRDKGCGFDPEAVAADSHGITHSIRGRLERCGGRARVESAPGAGTEWELEVPL